MAARRRNNELLEFPIDVYIQHHRVNINGWALKLCAWLRHFRGRWCDEEPRKTNQSLVAS